MARPSALRVGLVCAAAAASAAAAGPAATAPQAAVCRAARVHYAPYPGGAPGLGRLPWVAGTPSRSGLVGLLWYWPRSWRSARVAGARIFTGGKAPAGASTKILWAFLAPAAKRAYRSGDLVVRGSRLDGPGRTSQRFGAIAYAGQDGAPSFASIVTLPTPGCWRLRLETAGLRATVVLRAVPGR